MFASLFQHVDRKSGPAPQRRVGLAVEALEGRTLPSTALTSSALPMTAPDAHATALVGSGGDVLICMSRSTGEEIPQ
jgi:hypothetical protein